MSPEQREGRPATPQSDVYGVGAILFELLTGERPSAEGEGARARPSAAHRDLDARHDEAVLAMIARDPAGRPADAFAARRSLLALPWPTSNEPAAPRPKERPVTARPEASRAELRADGTGYDRWIERAFEHVPLDERTLARASAFALAGHEGLQAVLRVDRDASRIWLEARGTALQGPLSKAQLDVLAGALSALHALGVPHGRVDREHVRIDDAGAPLLRFAASIEPTATMDRDRLALVRLGETP
jgi:serine/threonine-protein kinase